MAIRRHEFGFPAETDEGEAKATAVFRWHRAVERAGETTVGNPTVQRVDSPGLERTEQYSIEVIGEVNHE